MINDRISQEKTNAEKAKRSFGTIARVDTLLRCSSTQAQRIADDRPMGIECVSDSLWRYFRTQRVVARSQHVISLAVGSSRCVHKLNCL